MIPLPPTQTNTKVVSVTIPKTVHAAARTFVDHAKMSLSVYVTALLRQDLEARSSPPPVKTKNKRKSANVD